MWGGDSDVQETLLTDLLTHAFIHSFIIPYLLEQKHLR